MNTTGMTHVNTWREARTMEDTESILGPTTQAVNSIPRSQGSSLAPKMGPGVGQRTSVPAARPGGKDLMAAFHSCPELGEDDPCLDT